MKRILITGATGNVGTAVIHSLCALDKTSEIIAAVRKPERAKSRFSLFPNVQYRRFDFEDPRSFQAAFADIDTLFLLRPPQISDVETYFRPLLQAAKEQGIEKIVFLSVQGAEKSTVIPHNKIERLIQSMHIAYIFVRPSYFMQNLTTTLRPEIIHHRTITLPSGKAKFNWIDVENIGEASAVLINSFDQFRNQALEITGTENRSFGEVAELMSQVIQTDIKFTSINPIRFYLRKKKEGLESGFALVMTILHFLPRLQKEPAISGNFQQLTGKSPTTLSVFLKREKEKLIPSPTDSKL
jgi:uncharacterized protein YbjT (DUF2867 family)